VTSKNSIREKGVMLMDHKYYAPQHKLFASLIPRNTESWRCICR